MSRPTVILDNGAGSMKIGYLSLPCSSQQGVVAIATPRSNSSVCLSVPNFIAKSKTGRKKFISNQIADCNDTSGLFLVMPFKKGYICSIDDQKTIWEHVFGPDGLNINFKETDLIMTEPLFNFASIQAITCELLFEDFGFRSVCRTSAPHLAEYNYVQDKLLVEDRKYPLCTLIVDSGFSFTHVVPFIDGRIVKDAIRRIDVGGKALTNHLKEIISYRQMNVMDEVYLMNQVKEDLCYVSDDFMADMAQAKLKRPENKIYREYVMPDFSTIKRGYIRSEEDVGTKPKNFEQILKMNNERFSVPELLFNPSDIGVNQMGIPDLVHEVIKGFPESVQPHLYTNILLIGGNVNIPGFRDRVYNEVRKLAPDLFDVHVTAADDPATYACHGGNRLGYNGGLGECMVSKEKYLAEGMAAFGSILIS